MKYSYTTIESWYSKKGYLLTYLHCSIANY